MLAQLYCRRVRCGLARANRNVLFLLAHQGERILQPLVALSANARGIISAIAHDNISPKESRWRENNRRKSARKMEQTFDLVAPLFRNCWKLIITVRRGVINEYFRHDLAHDAIIDGFSMRDYHESGGGGGRLCRVRVIRTFYRFIIQTTSGGDISKRVQSARRGWKLFKNYRRRSPHTRPWFPGWSRRIRANRICHLKHPEPKARV